MVKVNKFRDPSDQEAIDAMSIATSTRDDTPSLTHQGFAAESDINNIVKMFGVSNIPVPPEISDPRYYGDMSDIPDLHTALMRVKEATDRFNALPARLRGRFQNQPAELWDFLQDRENYDEAISLGLLVRDPAEQPQAPPAPASPPATPPVTP